MRDIVKRYTSGDLTVVWQPGLCIHSQVCFHGLPAVFDPRKRPWVNMEGAAGAAIVEQVRRCPSGALSLAAPTATSSTGRARARCVAAGSPRTSGSATVRTRRPDFRADGAGSCQRTNRTTDSPPPPNTSATACCRYSKILRSCMRTIGYASSPSGASGNR